MSRSSLFILLMVASSLVIAAQQPHTNYQRNFDDFRGQRFCANRASSREGTCCSSRYDECSVPIGGKFTFTFISHEAKLELIIFTGTLCYCDEFCDQHINPDCCPDYENVCLGKVDPIIERCQINEATFITRFEEAKDNCNVW